MSSASTLFPEDFHDRLSPMVVKEVRQGLRSRTFIVTFMILHLALVIWSAAFLSADASGGRGSDGFFWFILFCSLAAIGFRGMGAVKGERDAKTLELLQLTRLTAWNIVAGKWISLMTEAVMVVAGVLPYFVLRYYFGTLNLVEDALVVVILLAGCGLLCAGMVMISCLGRVLGIIAKIGAFLFGLQMLFGMLAFMFNGRGVLFTGGLADNAGVVALYVLLAVPYAMIALGVSAASVATASENLATRQRLWALTLPVPGLIAWACGMSDSIFGPLLACALPAYAVVVFESVLRRSNTSLPLYAEVFAKSWRRWMAWLLAPTMGAGWVFATLSWVAIATVFYCCADLSTGERKNFFAAMIAVYNLVMLPAAAAIWVRRVVRVPFAVRYWAWAAIMILPVIFLLTLDGKLRDFGVTAAGVFPLGVLCNLNQTRFVPSYAFSVCAVHTLLVAGTLGAFLVADWRARRAMMRGERVAVPVA